MWLVVKRQNSNQTKRTKLENVTALVPPQIIKAFDSHRNKRPRSLCVQFIAELMLLGEPDAKADGQGVELRQ